jgi:hypothetical protein
VEESLSLVGRTATSRAQRGRQGQGLGQGQPRRLRLRLGDRGRLIGSFGMGSPS